MIGVCTRCRRLCSWPEGASLYAAAPKHARMAEHRCGGRPGRPCSGTLRAWRGTRREAKGRVHYDYVTRATSRQLALPHTAPRLRPGAKPRRATARGPGYPVVEPPLRRPRAKPAAASGGEDAAPTAEQLGLPGVPLQAVAEAAP